MVYYSYDNIQVFKRAGLKNGCDRWLILQIAGNIWRESNGGKKNGGNGKVFFWREYGISPFNRTYSDWDFVRWGWWRRETWISRGVPASRQTTTTTTCCAMSTGGSLTGPTAPCPSCLGGSERGWGYASRAWADQDPIWHSYNTSILCKLIDDSISNISHI